MLSGRCQYASLRVLIRRFRQITRGVAFCLIAATLSSRQAIGQEVHITPQTHSVVEGDKATESPRTRYGTLRVNVDLVLVPVTVTDSFGRFITGLGKEDFQIYEGKEKQVIRIVSSEDSPVSIGIIFDTSGSMVSKIERARETVEELFETANPQDEFFLITFADVPELVTDFTTSFEDLQRQLPYKIAQGSTSLLDAIYLGISKMRQAHCSRKALVIISDGGDNHSRYHEREIRAVVREGDTLVYAIGIYDRYYSTIEEQLGPALLTEVSEESGGRMFTVDDPKDLAGIATRISLELRNQYVLAYRPTSPKCDGKWHKIKVKLSPPKGFPRVETHFKQGYYAYSE